MLWACHDQKHSMWEASGHSKSISRVTNSPRATADCYGCHSAEGFAAKREGKKVDLAAKESLHSVGCLACHDPRGAKYAGQTGHGSGRALRILSYPAGRAARPWGQGH